MSLVIIYYGGIKLRLIKDVEINRDDFGNFKQLLDEFVTEIKEEAIPLLITEFKNEFKR